MRDLARNLTRSTPGVILALTLAGLLAACAVGPDYVRPNVHPPAVFAEAQAPVYSSAPPATPRFWEQFGDPTLDQLVDDALAANRDLRIAVAHLEEARAVHRLSRFDLFPTVTGSGGYTHEGLPTTESFGLGEPIDERYYDAGFDATWELDLFGRVRRGVEASRADVQGAEASLRDAQVSVTGEVARVYFELRGEQSELEVARGNVANQRATLDLTEQELDAGRGTELDTSRAQSELSSTLATIPPLEAAIDRSMHRLAVLTARPPDALDGLLRPVRELPALPPIVDVGDPAALLRRRPDIRVAERELAAATARIGVAVGDLFPKVTFDGSFGYAAGDPGALATGGTRAFLIGPSISWAAFDLGRVRANIAGARARTDAALANYQKTVLDALEDTENALVTHARAREQLVHAEEAARASRTAAQIASNRFQGGLS
ncbi:MAG: efflux transporter outer membrane subunit, partial [Steroidobacteraceae bacterium]